MLKYYKVILKSFTHKRITYTYGGIDSLILNIFKNQKNGFYLDIGCGHPIKNNNTYLLNKKGWRGINIDLDFNSIDMFNFFRPFIFKFSPEIAHSLAIKVLKLNNFPINKIVKSEILQT